MPPRSWCATCWRATPPRASTRSSTSAPPIGPAPDDFTPRLVSSGRHAYLVSIMKDPYEVLGVEKTASEAAIRAAYRKLAKRHHPDLNPGKPEAAERFKEINAANDILSDTEKRARYDRGEIDAAGNEVPPERPFYRDFGDAPGSEKYHANVNPEDLESIFAHAFGRGGARPGATGGRRFNARGPDAHYTLTVGFLDAANGPTRRITLPEGRTLDVRIPAGVRDGHILRLKGQGMPGLGDGPPGDALVEIAVAP